MPSLKILITGGSGFLGEYLNVELSKKFDVLTLYKNNQGNCGKFSNQRIDITDSDSLEKIFGDFKPDVVIHTAAVSSQYDVERLSSKEVYLTNVSSTQKIAELCASNKCRLIYTSTDLVYAGYRGSLLNENSKLIPVSLYAETKLMGEKKIEETFGDFIILRTALLFGFGITGSKSHFQKTVENLKSEREVKLFSDQFRSPLYVKDAARMIGELIEKNIKGEIINFGGPERLSRFELGKILCEEAGYNKSLLKEISMDDIPGFVKVEDVSMNVEKLESFGIFPATVREAMQDIFRDEIK